MLKNLKTKAGLAKTHLWDSERKLWVLRAFYYYDRSTRTWRIKPGYREPP